MSDVVLKVENLSKQYRLGEIGTGTISHDLNRWWARIRGKNDPFSKIGQVNDRTKKAESDFVWALKDINFEVKKGEVLGIIGKNGAGKSTLLKLISRITAPTTGFVKAKGRIASLLEVGTGMHPEMTARENIYLNGAIMGMTKKEIKRKFDEIIDFAGCTMYVDTPVKRFSSGMRVRLGFAVAAFLEPEILIVDEVLAVGDAEFQKKAVGKMKDVSAGDGRTVLFVSHNMASVKSLCGGCVFLENGTVAAKGATTDMIERYINSSFSDLSYHKVWDNLEDSPHTDFCRLIEARVDNKNEFAISEDLELSFKFELTKGFPKFNLSLVISTQDNIPIFNSISDVVSIEKGIHTATVVIPANYCNNIKYKARILLVNNSKMLLDVDEVLAWEAQEVAKRKAAWFGKFIGYTRPELEWKFD